jgi:hypothetical protein
MIRRIFLVLLIGFGLGVLAGVLVGWFAPIQDVTVGFDKLHPDWKAEYTVMVGASYAANHDWDLAQQRLGRLAEPDPAAYVVLLAERYIAQGRSPEDIRNLVRLAVQMGYATAPMQPYIPAPAGS